MQDISSKFQTWYDPKHCVRFLGYMIQENKIRRRKLIERSETDSPRTRTTSEVKTDFARLYTSPGCQAWWQATLKGQTLNSATTTWSLDLLQNHDHIGHQTIDVWSLLVVDLLYVTLNSLHNCSQTTLVSHCLATVRKFQILSIRLIFTNKIIEHNPIETRNAAQLIWLKRLKMKCFHF